MYVSSFCKLIKSMYSFSLNKNNIKNGRRLFQFSVIIWGKGKLCVQVVSRPKVLGSWVTHICKNRVVGHVT